MRPLLSAASRAVQVRFSDQTRQPHCAATRDLATIIFSQRCPVLRLTRARPRASTGARVQRYSHAANRARSEPGLLLRCLYYRTVANTPVWPASNPISRRACSPNGGRKRCAAAKEIRVEPDLVVWRRSHVHPPHNPAEFIACGHGRHVRLIRLLRTNQEEIRGCRAPLRATVSTDPLLSGRLPKTPSSAKRIARGEQPCCDRETPCGAVSMLG